MKSVTIKVKDFFYKRQISKNHAILYILTGLACYAFKTVNMAHLVQVVCGFLEPAIFDILVEVSRSFLPLFVDSDGCQKDRLFRWGKRVLHHLPRVMLLLYLALAIYASLNGSYDLADIVVTYGLEKIAERGAKFGSELMAEASFFFKGK